MHRVRTSASAAIALIPALAPLSPSATLAGQMRQSPAMMRRAGPSCTPGHLGGSRYAGYNYLLGPCRGIDAAAPQGGRAAPR